MLHARAGESRTHTKNRLLPVFFFFCFVLFGFLRRHNHKKKYNTFFGLAKFFSEYIFFFLGFSRNYYSIILFFEIGNTNETQPRKYFFFFFAKEPETNFDLALCAKKLDSKHTNFKFEFSTERGRARSTDGLNLLPSSQSETRSAGFRQPMRSKRKSHGIVVALFRLNS